MKLSYLIDTDCIIHYLNGNSGIVEKIGLLEKEGLAARQKGSVREFRNYSFIGVIPKNSLSPFHEAHGAQGIERSACLNLFIL